MKRGIVIFFTLFIAAQLLVVPSCKKSEGLATLFSRVLGTWKEAKYATDDNGNGVIDPSEIHPVPADIDNELTFNKDSAGVSTTNGFPLNFTWSIIEGSELMVSYSANDTIEYNLIEISSDDLTLTTYTNLGLTWYYYIRK